MITLTLIFTEKDGIVINIINTELHLNINLGDLDRCFLIRNVKVKLTERPFVVMFIRKHDQIKLQQKYRNIGKKQRTKMKKLSIFILQFSFTF